MLFRSHLCHYPFSPVDAQGLVVQFGLEPASPGSSFVVVAVVVDAAATVVMETAQLLVAGARVYVSGRHATGASSAAMVTATTVTLPLGDHKVKDASATANELDHVFVGRLGDVDVIDGQDVVARAQAHVVSGASFQNAAQDTGALA